MKNWKLRSFRSIANVRLTFRRRIPAISRPLPSDSQQITMNYQPFSRECGSTTAHRPPHKSLLYRWKSDHSGLFKSYPHEKRAGETGKNREKQGARPIRYHAVGRQRKRPRSREALSENRSLWYRFNARSPQNRAVLKTGLSINRESPD